MRLLILADSFSRDGTDTWLVEDLVGALVEDGHSVDVLVRDTTRPRRRGAQPHPSGAAVFSVGVTKQPRGRWQRRAQLAPSLVHLWWSGRRHVASRRYDAVLFTSIAWTKARLPQHLVRRGVAQRSVLVYWDFFPIHQSEIGHLPAALKPLLPLARWVERRSVSDTDVVAVMSERNRDFFVQYFGTVVGRFVIQPPWGRDMAESPIDVVPVCEQADGPTVVVFGGQITAGRGLEDMLVAAELLERAGADVVIRVFGDGDQRTELIQQVAALGLRNVEVRGRIPREEYWKQLREAHCGLAATVPGVSVSSFPSKIVDYAAAGLPVVVSSEASSDVGDVVTRNGVGYAVSAGDPQALAKTLARVSRERRTDAWPRIRAAAGIGSIASCQPSLRRDASWLRLRRTNAGQFALLTH